MANQPSEYSRIEDVIANLAEAGKKKQRGKAAISAAAAVGSAIGQSVGEGRGVQPVSPTTGTGIASPLDVTAMSGVSSMQMASTDGWWVLNLPREVDMTDASGRAVQVRFPA